MEAAMVWRDLREDIVEEFLTLQVEYSTAKRERANIVRLRKQLAKHHENTQWRLNGYGSNWRRLRQLQLPGISRRPAQIEQETID
jgi:hypothetical protein